MPSHAIDLNIEGPLNMEEEKKQRGRAGEAGPAASALRLTEEGQPDGAQVVVHELVDHVAQHGAAQSIVLRVRGTFRVRPRKPRAALR